MDEMLMKTDGGSWTMDGKQPSTVYGPSSVMKAGRHV